MLKILHTADWHIGQNFFGHDRKKEHQHFFDWLDQAIKENEVDVLLIAGDIFDVSNPSAESQRLFYSFLHRVSSENLNLQIVIIAGNHDSAARLEAINPILEGMNISIVGTVEKNEAGEICYDKFIIPLKKDGETLAWCIAIPYLRQGDYPPAPSYPQGVEAMYDAVYEHLTSTWEKPLPIVFMGHLHASGAILSKEDRSERVVVGGVESISPSVFIKENVVYTALGHLHRGQAVGEVENIRYSGSPLPMSFAEKDYEQGIDMIEINAVNEVKISRIFYKPFIPLLSVPFEPAPLKDVLLKLDKLPDGDASDMSPFLEVKVLLTEPEPSMRYMIEQALKGKDVRFVSAPITKLSLEQEDVRQLDAQTLKTIQPIDMAQDVFRKKYGTEMPESMKDLLSNLIRTIQE